MHTLIASTFGRIGLGRPESHANLTVFPLMSDLPVAPDYLLLDDALASGTGRVSEVSASGSVPELAFENGADRRVLIIDGQELVGARQNRVLNISILAPAGKRLVIPVSCCEQGRWHYRDSTDFAVSRSALFSSSRANMMRSVSDAMLAEGRPRADQSAVWRDIAMTSSSLEVESSTGAMADIYAQRKEQVRAYRSAISARPGQVGAVMCIDGQAAGIELFDSAATFKRLLGRIVRSYALDALATPQPASVTPAAEIAEALIARLREAAARAFPAVGEGEDLRLSGDGVVGGALIADGRVRHLAGFRLDGASRGLDRAGHRAHLMRSRAMM